ncbi:uncharacterized protein LOC121681939 isoform X2 [Alosa sapidissima]|uniref:uncharacterized protein LOC121681939 isoform X2 n=1 Tax=Alosa sapidissima TaxID=34773 RepID=UPI001C083BEA|nr:uncharacterized protein LOC121681939 isoform X2 [Alosa sapidissima]
MALCIIFGLTWVRHKSDEIPVVLLVAGPNESDGSLYSKDHIHHRFKAVANQSRESNDLRISNVTEEDLALYYCIGRVKGKQKFGIGTRLYQDKAEGVDDILPTKAPFQNEDHHFNLYWLFAGLRGIGLLIFVSAILTVNIKKRKTHQTQIKKYSHSG